jgi:uncharacterized membrane protein
VSNKLSVIDPRLIWFGLAGIALYILGTQSYHLWLSLLSWRYIHLLSATVYAGIVFTSACIEALAFFRGDLDFIRGYHDVVRVLDQRLITLSVTGLLLSALALMKIMGFEDISFFTPEPFWAWLALVLILSNGLYWLAFDVPNQRQLSRLFDEAQSPELTPEMRRLLFRRMWVNLPSVLLLPVLYFLMVFKPTLPI